MQLDDKDKQLINILQNEFPLCPRPFRHIAQRLSIEESEVIKRVNQLKTSGYIRRIGPIFDPKMFGYKSCLLALTAPDDMENDIISFTNSLINVTHNYKRAGKYNIWFTFIYKSEAELSGLVSGLKTKYKLKDIMVLPSLKTYKLRTNFDAR